MSNESSGSQKGSAHSRPTWRFMKGGVRGDIRVLTSVAHMRSMISVYYEVELNLQLWSIRHRESVAGQPSQNVGLSVDIPSHIDKGLRCEVTRILSEELRSAGWIQFRPRTREWWLKLSSGRALLYSLSPRPPWGMYSLYQVQLQLRGGGREEGDSLEELLTRSLHFAQRHDATPVEVNSADHGAETQSITLEFAQVDQHLIDWAVSHPQVDLLEVSSRDMNVDTFQEAKVPRGEPQLWSQIKQPKLWPQVSQIDALTPVTPTHFLSDATVDQDTDDQPTQWSGLETFHLPLCQISMPHRATVPGAQIYDAFLFAESSSALLSEAISHLPTQLIRRVGVSILTGPLSGRTNTDGISHAHQDSDIHETFVFVRLMGLDYLTSPEKKELLRLLPLDQSVDHLIKISAHPLMYQSKNMKLSPPLQNHELANVVYEELERSIDRSQRHRLIINSAYLSSMWHQARSRKQSRIDRSLDRIGSDQVTLVEVYPWHEYFDRDLAVALSKLRQLHLNRWLNEASITFSVK